VANTTASAVKAAFLMPANLLGLLAGAIASAVVGDPTPAVAAACASALYLGLLSSAPTFRRAVRANLEAQDIDAASARQALEALLAELSPSQREHYAELRELRDKILLNYGRLPGGRVMAASSEARLDALLTSFVRLLHTLNTYRQSLGATDRKVLEVELSQLEAEVAGEDNPRLKEVKGRRVEILKKRVLRFAQAEESREVVSHQLASIEDVMRLTHEQSIAIRDPEAVTRQLEALTLEVEATEETVRDMEKFVQFSDEVQPAVSHGAKVRS
jgi:hypothetical protein